MKHLALVIGHGPSVDKGAENADGTTELDWNRDLAVRIARNLVGKLRVTVVHRTIERSSPIAAVNALGADMAAELHLNAFNTNVSGTEMIICPGSSKGRLLATILQRAAVSVLGLPDRGVKTPQARGRGSSFVCKTRPPAVIIESFFIDNSADLAKANSVKEELAQGYARGFLEFAATLV